MAWTDFSGETDTKASMSESLLRTGVKTLSYRLLGSSVTFAIAYVFTGEITVSAGISVTEFLLKPMMYWMHERAWNRIHWQRR